ncbi:MAG: hypothetical protein AAF293_00255 [Pseudomonadota bacterium]
MEDNIKNRRQVLCLLLSSTATARLAPSAVVLGSGVFSANRAHAVEPVTVIAAVGVAVSAISSIVDSSRSGGIDPATQAYMEQILSNQEQIISSLKDLSTQMEIVAELVAFTPAATVSLDEDIEASAVLSDFLLSYQGARDADEVGPEDLAAFRAARERMRRTASRHRSIADEIGHSYDLVASADTLVTAISTLVAIAKVSGYTSEDHKNQLKVVAGNVRQTLDALNREPVDITKKSLADIGTEFYLLKNSARNNLATTMTTWGRPPVDRDAIMNWLGAIGDDPFNVRVVTGSQAGIGFEDVTTNNGVPTQDFTIRYWGNATLNRELITGLVDRPNHFNINAVMPNRHQSGTPLPVPGVISKKIAEYNMASAAYHLHAETLSFLSISSIHLNGVFEAIDKLGEA